MAAKKTTGRAKRKVTLVPRATRELRYEDDTIIEVEVKESVRAKRLRITVSDRGVRMSVPRGTSDSEVDRFIDSNRSWIAKTLRHQNTALANQLGLEQAGVVWQEGKPLKALRSNGSRSRAFLALYQGEKVLAVSGARSKAAAAVESWCREELRRIAEEIIAREAPLLGVSVKKLRIADQRTRWGSASSNGTISLNWRLLLAPRRVIEYVVIHELCHLLEMNHSKRFWAHVERRCPDWRTDKKWLHDYGWELQRWAPARALVSR